MTLSELAEVSIGDAEPIVLSTEEARDIVGVVAEAETRRESLIEQNIVLEADKRRLEARVTELETAAEYTRLSLAAALFPKVAA